MTETITPEKGLGKKKSGEIYRLQKFMSERSLQPSDIFDKTGISARTITHSLYEEKPLGSKILRALHLHYGVSMDWLISGTGHMFVNGGVSESTENYHSDNPRTQRIVNFVTEFMTYASDDEQAWLETELKFNLKQYDRFVKDNA